ncbi:MAG: hypothetical protein KIS78_27745, partial [Labilithrix sp.]|nr:hypothetical protein [Labilithrix sp.]
MRRPSTSPLLAVLLLVSSCKSGDAQERVDESSPTSPALDTNDTNDTNHPGATRDGGTRERDGASTAPPDPEPSGPPRVDFVGRFDARDPAGPTCAWPGCRIVARFEGTRVTARLEEITQSWMTGGPSEWDVTIDGALRPKLVMEAGAHEYVLATDLPPGEHVVELYKRSEAQTGATRFLGYDFAGGKLLAPPGRHLRKLEIIGDSQPAAFGVEGVGQGPMCPGLNYAAKWQNFRKSFGALLGEALKADVQGTVYSGKGMVKNIWRPDKDTMPVVFPRAVPTIAASPWDFTAYVPDVVIVMIGGNDFAIGQPEDDGAPTVAQFTDTYDAFVVDVRQHYPHAHVFLATSPSVSDAEPPGRQSRTHVMEGVAGVVARRNGAGDTRVYAVTPSVAPPSELTGCEGHGSPAFHQRVADELAPRIREKTGW